MSNYTGGLGSSAVSLTSRPNTMTIGEDGYFEMLVPYGSYNLVASLSGGLLGMQKNQSELINVSATSGCPVYAGTIYLSKEVEVSVNAEVTRICGGNTTQEITVKATAELTNANLTLNYSNGTTQIFAMDCDKKCTKKLSIPNADGGNYSFVISDIVDKFGNKYPDANGTFTVATKIPQISISSQLLEGNNVSANIVITSENNISDISVEILNTNNQTLNVNVTINDSKASEKKYVATFNTEGLSTYIIRVNVTDSCGSKASKSTLVRYAEVYPQTVSFCGEGKCFDGMGSGYGADNGQRNDLFSTVFFKNSSKLSDLTGITGKNVTDEIPRVWREARSVVNYNSLYYTAYEEWQNDIPKVYVKAYNSGTDTSTKININGLSNANVKSYKPYLHRGPYDWFLAYVSNESDAMGGVYVAKYNNNFNEQAKVSIGVGTDMPVVTVCGSYPDEKVYVAYQFSDNIYVKIYNYNLVFLEDKNITNFTGEVFSAEAPSILCGGNTIYLAYQVNKKLPETTRMEWESNFKDANGDTIWVYMLVNKTENKIFIDKYDINLNSATGSNNATIEVIDKKGGQGIPAATLPNIVAYGNNKYITFITDSDLFVRKYTSSFTSTTLSTEDDQYLAYLNQSISSVSKPFSIQLEYTINWQLRTDMVNNSKNETFMATVVKTQSGDIIHIKNISNGNVTTVLNESGSEPAINYYDGKYYLAYVNNGTIIIEQYNESMKETGLNATIQNENASSPSITIKDNVTYIVYLSNKSGTMNVYMNKYNMSLILNETTNITKFINTSDVNPT
ncbi:MAG: hypothetical protein CVT88_06455, partial [Candidatus Altiarchaeales archaeon HGW-Altiarchaeales-1]